MRLEKYITQIIETIVVILGTGITRLALLVMVRRIAVKFSYKKPRVVMVRKLIDALCFGIFIGGLLSVWGVERSELAFFLSSMLTILGIAFFAQWSILSNLTSTFIIFFSHPAGIGDRVTVIDNELHIDGVIMDIGIFFVKLSTQEGDVITIPNNVFIQKVVRRSRTNPPLLRGRGGSGSGVV